MKSRSLTNDVTTPSSVQNMKQQQTTRFYGARYLEDKSSDVGIAATPPGANAHLPASSKQRHGWYTDNMGGGDNDGGVRSGGCGGNVINTRKYFREVYGPFLCSLLLTSAFLVILGSVLMLAGFYVPSLPIDHLVGESDDDDRNNPQKMEALKKAVTHNDALSGLRISGVVLLAIGVIGLTILFLTPIVCLRHTEYALLPACSDDVLPRSSFSSAASGLPEDMFTFSVVKQHIQPKKKSATKASGSPKTRHGRGTKQRANYDKGFLSPELNRAPIFVSEDKFSIRNNIIKGKNRIRSSSFDSRLSPRYSQHIRTSRFSPPGSLTPDVQRTFPVKSGSFHCLR